MISYYNLLIKKLELETDKWDLGYCEEGDRKISRLNCLKCGKCGVKT